MIGSWQSPSGAVTIEIRSSRLPRKKPPTPLAVRIQSRSHHRSSSMLRSNSCMTVPLIAAALIFVLAPPARSADNELTPEEKAAGWQLLFNGKDHTGWRCDNGRPIATKVENGSLLPYKSGGYIIVYDKQFSDFILKCDVKMDTRCNSGVFFRVGDLSDPVQTGFE